MVQPRVIDTKSDVDDYLHALLESDKCKSVSDFLELAIKYIPNAELQAYFMDKARESLKALG